MIELYGVSKTVRSGGVPLTILHPLDLQIPAGRFLAVVGPSGSGKTTLLGLMAGLESPSSGRVLLDGVDVTALDADRAACMRRTKIGFVFQHFHLIPSLTALENVQAPLEIAGAARAGYKARALLDDVGLTARGHHYPSELSGGELQRVAVARAMANDPPILLADEPTGNLDATNGQRVVELLQHVNRMRGTTVVVATHDVDVARHSDEVMTLRDGRAVEASPSPGAGTPDGVRA